MPDYITDPELLKMLEGNTPQAPAQAPAPSGPAYVTDPSILAQLEGRPNPNATPEAPWGNGVQAGVTSALNTGSLNAYRNALAAVTYGLGKIGVEGYPNESFENHYQKWKRYDDEVAAQNPKSALAGTVAGVGGAALAVPYALPEAGMAALYAGGLPAIGRSAAIGATTAGLGQFADDHDLKKAAVAAAAGGVGGMVADKAANIVGPLFKSADRLQPAEVAAAFGRAAAPGTPAAARAGLGNMVRQGIGATIGGSVGAGVGAAAGSLLPGDYTAYAAAGGAGLSGAEAGRRVMAGIERSQNALAADRLHYRKGNAGAALVGAAIPQVFNGLLGP